MEAPRLYVGNLPYVARERDIEKLFADNDISVKKIDTSIDPFTGRNPSYCFVDVASEQDSIRALEILQGQNVRGRPIRVNFKTEQRGSKTHQPTKTFDRGWKPKEVPERKDASSHWTAPADEERRLYVGGLPRISGQDAVNAEMKELFEGWEVEAVSKIISPHPSKQSQPGSHYYCFVDLPTAQEAQDAQQSLDGKASPYGGTYKVRLGNQRRPTKVQREQLSGQWQEQVPDPPKRDLKANWSNLDYGTGSRDGQDGKNVFV